MESCAALGPMETATNSVATFFSFKRTASSTNEHKKDVRKESEEERRILLTDGNFAERVQRHLDIVEVNTRLVRKDANLDGVINDTLDGHQNFHFEKQLQMMDRRRFVRLIDPTSDSLSTLCMTFLLPKKMMSRAVVVNEAFVFNR